MDNCHIPDLVQEFSNEENSGLQVRHRLFLQHFQETTNEDPD